MNYFDFVNETIIILEKIIVAIYGEKNCIRPNGGFGHSFGT
jgi:hypothetical protein